MTQKIWQTVGAFLCWFAVIAQCYLLIENRITSIPEAIIRFFSFFTILTNIAVAVFFTTNFFGQNNRVKLFFQKPSTATAIVVYISIVGLVYQIILRHVWEPKGLQMVVDELLHSVIPLVCIVYWFLFVHKKNISWSDLPYWLIYPLLYVIFIFFRGNFSGFYPYPFLDVTILGFNKVLVNTTGLILVFLLFSAMFIGIAKLMTKNSINKSGQ